MKIVTLNIWAGMAGEKLIHFFKENQDVDIFCLQEVMHEATEWTHWDERQNKNILSEIRLALPEYVDYYRPAERNEWGLAMFVKKSVDVEEEGEIFIHREKDSMQEKDGTSLGKNLQWLKLKDTPITICNIHGLWNGMGKTDTEDRLSQSKKIIAFVKSLNTQVILCGDFNLLPGTQSLQMIEGELNLRNLIKEFNITSTRTSYYQKPEKFADYMLVSQGIRVKDFKVLPDEVSDHSPLYLEIA